MLRLDAQVLLHHRRVRGEGRTSQCPRRRGRHRRGGDHWRDYIGRGGEETFLKSTHFDTGWSGARYDDHLRDEGQEFR